VHDMIIPWHTLLLSFASELGEKSFFLTAILAAWCPVQGIRSGPRLLLQLCLVALGSLCALAVQTLLLSASRGGSPWYGTIFSRQLLSSLSFFVDAGLGVLAIFHLRHAEHYRLPSPNLSKESPLPSSSQPVVHDAVAYSSPGKLYLGFKTYDPNSYGAVAQSGLSPRGADNKNPFDANDTRERMPAPPSSIAGAKATVITHNNDAVGLFLAFVVSFLVVLVAERGNRAAGMIDLVGSATVDALGMVAGSTLGIAIAVFLGCLSAHNFSERRLLFAVALGTWSIWLVTASQNLSLLCMRNFLAPASAEVVPAHATSSLPKSLRSAQFPKIRS